MTGFFTTLRVIWRLAAPYFRSEDRWAGWMLLGALIATELSLVAIDVLINRWNARFYNALQERDWDTFVSELSYFFILAMTFIVLAVCQLYLNYWLQIRWRTWMNKTYLERWLVAANHYRMQLLGDAADNPDQRIADDIKLFVEKTLYVGTSLLSSIVTLSSFVVILWVLSADAPLRLFGQDVAIPGYLVWAALIYAMIGTALTHWIGRALIALNFRQQRYEADYRFALVRVRENSEQIALLDGERAERGRLLDRFTLVADNWYRIMARLKWLTLFTQSYSQVSLVFPYVVVSPAYFSGRVQLGGLMQIASAFNSVQRAVSVFITIYRDFAEWRAVIERLDGFDRAIAEAQVAAHTPPVIEVLAREGQQRVEIDDLAVRLPTGRPLVAADDLAFAAGDRVLVNGPSGSGKSTLFRAIAGVWPFGTGTVLVPKDARVMMLPQRPYYPIATLAAAISYPGERGTFSDAEIVEVLTAVGFPAMAGRLEEEAHWNRMLSLGEQQRLAIARAILHAPDYLFLDEATASLDERSEAALYKLLHDRLAGTTIVSIGHRSTLAAFHRRRLELESEGDRYRVRETALQPAAE